MKLLRGYDTYQIHYESKFTISLNAVLFLKIHL